MFWLQFRQYMIISAENAECIQIQMELKKLKNLLSNQVFSKTIDIYRVLTQLVIFIYNIFVLTFAVIPSNIGYPGNLQLYDLY